MTRKTVLISILILGFLFSFIVVGAQEESLLDLMSAPFVTTPAKVLKSHTEPVTAVAYSPDGKIVASGSLDNTIKLWNPDTGGLIRTIHGRGSWVRYADMSDDGSIFVCYESPYKTLKLVTPDGLELCKLAGDPEIEYKYKFLIFSPDKSLFATLNDDSSISIRNVKGGDVNSTLQKSEMNPNLLKISHHNKLICAGNKNSLLMFSIADGALIKTFINELDILDFHFSPNDKRIALMDDSKIIKLIDVESASIIATIDRFSNEKRSVQFTPDGKTLIYGSNITSSKEYRVSTDNSLRFFDMVQLKINAEIPVDSKIIAIDISRDGKFLAFGCFDGTTKVLDIFKRNVIFDVQSLDGCGRLAKTMYVTFSSDSRLIASISLDNYDEPTIKVWSVEEKKQIGIIRDLKPVRNEFTFCDADNHIMIFESSYSKNYISKYIISFEKEYKYKGIQNWVGIGEGIQDLAISKDSTVIIAVDNEYALNRWSLNSGRFFNTIDSGIESFRNPRISPNGDFLVYLKGKDKVIVYSMSQDKMLYQIKDAMSPDYNYSDDYAHRMPRDMVGSIDFSPDSEILYTGKSGEIGVWSLLSGGLIKNITGYSSGCFLVAASLDGKTIMTNGNSGSSIVSLITGTVTQHESGG